MHNSFKLLYNENFNLTDHPEILSLIQQNQQQSIRAFSHYVPELVNHVKQHDERFDIFFNHNQQLNICDTHSQLALYSADPVTEVEKEVVEFIGNAPYISFSGQAGTDTEIKEIDVLLVFGVGLGLQLSALLHRVKVKYLLIYESSSSILRCSTFALNWQEFLNKATAVGTAVSIQIAKPGSEILDNLRELSSFLPDLDKVYLYRHICDPIYDEVINYLLDASGRSEILTKSGVQFLGYQAESDAVQLRAGSTLLNLAPALVKDKNDTFQQNITALLTYYPGLADAFSSYQPQRWLPAYDSSGQLNLYHKLRKCFLFRNREQEVASIVEQFKTQGQTGLSLLGQAVPWKLRHYLHFKTLKKIRDIEEKYRHLPRTVKHEARNLVVLGCVALLSYEFLTTCNPDNLVIFEREPDYFYASLFFIDWQLILKKYFVAKKSLSLNIGLLDNYAAEFFRLLQQSAYPNVKSTAFLQLSHSDAYNYQLAELKSDISSSQAVGDYFDHARYGINHSLLNIQAGAKFLEKTQGLVDYANYPVFIVGNGPSLDNLIPYISENKNRAIIVSCGTALSALMAYGIVPDFHAEAEQNRSTYPLIVNVKNSDKLKDINLISFSSVHPDTAKLFKDVYLAFKEGEAATALILNYVLGKKGGFYSVLEQAYPTVTNLAFSFITAAGFNTIYLFGVDFGQAEIGKHHSSKSIYFKEDGSERYDVQKKNPYDKTIPGNFRDFVKTKSEFDMARRTLEISLSRENEVQVYNCSDGAKIKGAIPLAPQNILLDHAAEEKAKLKEMFFSKFSKIVDADLNNFSFRNLSFNMFACWKSIFLEVPVSILEAQKQLEDSWSFLQRNVFEKNYFFALLYYNSLSYFYQSLQNIIYFEIGDDKIILDCYSKIVSAITGFVDETIVSIQEADYGICNAKSFV
jgi:hypothetical protein